MNGIEKDLRNLAIQATTDRSHYYVREAANRGANEIASLEEKLEKAIEALKFIDRHNNLGCVSDGLLNTVLKELK